MLERCEPVHTINDTLTCCLPSNLDMLPPRALRRPQSFSTLASARVSPLVRIGQAHLRLSRWPFGLPETGRNGCVRKWTDGFSERLEPISDMFGQLATVGQRTLNPTATAGAGRVVIGASLTLRGPVPPAPHNKGRSGGCGPDRRPRSGWPGRTTNSPRCVCIGSTAKSAGLSSATWSTSPITAFHSRTARGTSAQSAATICI